VRWATFWATLKQTYPVTLSYAAVLPDGLFSNQKDPNLWKIWRVWQWKILVYFMSIWSIFRPFGIFYGHLYIFPRFGSFLPVWVHFIFPRFGTFYPVLVCSAKKNLATLIRSHHYG
jgi:hypothetical protein